MTATNQPSTNLTAALPLCAWRDMRLWVALSVLAVDQLVKAGMKQAVFIPDTTIMLTSFFNLTPSGTMALALACLSSMRIGAFTC
jgi:lipoprotein signal peptidase